ncbi:MAG: YciI family protein [Proteobacteria bacterium]|nr:YciI family protein [Pseudomonadota bacterium]
MFNKLLVLGMIFITSYTGAQNELDKNLAKQLGADDYGMKTYVMALLKAGPNRDQDEETAQKLQQAHLANIRNLAEKGQLVLAGPFMANDHGLQGIYIFNVSTIEEAKKLTETDPAIKAGRLRMELIPWYGSATLPLINEWHEKISRKSF